MTTKKLITMITTAGIAATLTLSTLATPSATNNCSFAGYYHSSNDVYNGRMNCNGEDQTIAGDLNLHGWLVLKDTTVDGTINTEGTIRADNATIHQAINANGPVFLNNTTVTETINANGPIIAEHSSISTINYDQRHEETIRLNNGSHVSTINFSNCDSEHCHVIIRGDATVDHINYPANS